MQYSRRASVVACFALLSLIFVSVAWGAPKGRKAKTKPAARTVSSQDSGDYVVEKRSDGTTVKYKKKTTYDFEGLGLEGIHNKPSGSYISNIKDVKARSIIRMRENFDAEVVDSARQMK